MLVRDLWKRARELVPRRERLVIGSCSPRSKTVDQQSRYLPFPTDSLESCPVPPDHNARTYLPTIRTVRRIRVARHRGEGFDFGKRRKKLGNRGKRFGLMGLRRIE